MKALCAAILVTAVALSAPATADPVGEEPSRSAPPGAEQVRKAASAFDAGSQAYRAGKYELAASRFEAADAAVASARALRMAIRARTEAGQPGRASTLSELALTRHDHDAKTRALAKKTLQANRSLLHELKITCVSPCVLALGVRSVHGMAAKTWTLWVLPGERTIAASFQRGAGSDQQVIAARAASRNTLTFLPKATAAPAPDPAARPAPSGQDTGSAPTARPPSQPAEPQQGQAGANAVVDQESSTWAEHPAVFVVALLLTAGAGGTLIWSGVDALQTPGTAKVRDACAGKGRACPEYQQGLQSQLRTNILIGTTGGLGLITGLIGIFVTDWGRDDAATADSASSVLPVLGVTPGGGAFMTWRGAF